jgi:predicted anti-sigma-YlaC factor YlaD
MDDGRDTSLDAESANGGEHVDVMSLVLGEVDSKRRTEMAAHVLQCSTCRRDYDEMAVTVRELLAAVPAVQPPLGFDQRVLGRLNVSEVPGRTSRMRWLAGAAAAVIAVVAVLGWWITTDRQQESTGAVSALELVDGGGGVGTVSIGEVEGKSVMVVALVSAPNGVSYRCRTTFADGSMSESEPWPSGSGAWIVPLPASSDSHVDTVDLVVDGTTHVWSTASFKDSDV